MRVTGIACGLLIGGALGFALHAWLVSDAAVTPGAVRPRTADAQAAPEHPVAIPFADAPRASEPLRATGGASPVAGSDGAAADALVGILVHGAVLESGGQPAQLKNGWVNFDDGRGKPVTAEIGSQSTYAVSGLTPGEVSVSLDASGYRPFHSKLLLSAERPVVRFDIVLEPAVMLLIKGFTPEGEPLADAVARQLGKGDTWRAPRLTAIATREAPTGNLPEISYRAYDRWEIGRYTDRREGSWDGTSDMPLDVMGRLQVDEPLPAFVSLVLRHVLVATQRVEPGAKDVVFTVPVGPLENLLGTVRVHVVDADTGQPPASMRASLSDSQSGGGGDPPDATGTFVWERQRPGLLELSITSSGHETWDQEVSVPPGGTADLGTIALSPATKLSGVVADASGTPAVVRLRALRDDTDAGLGMGERRWAASNVEGAFEITGLGRHRYRVVASSDDWTAPPVFVDATRGDVSGVRITIEKGVLLRLHTLWPAGESYELRVASSDGVVISSSKTWRGDWTWAKRLPAGAYAITLLRDGRELQRVPVTLASADVAVDVGP